MDQVVILLQHHLHPVFNLWYDGQTARRYVKRIFVIYFYNIFINTENNIFAYAEYDFAAIIQ